jgi:SAM-dependent methyltransferase
VNASPEREFTLKTVSRSEQIVSAVNQVRAYYDANTPAFERFGQAGDAGAIRRAVWGEGVRTRARAFRYVDELILERVRAVVEQTASGVHVLDLGCGVGASVVFLASQAPIQATGVTISPVQAARATERIRRAGLEARVRCLEADFLALPDALARAQLGFSIEAFVHTPDPAGYFAAARRALAPGGMLIVCDDFATAAGSDPNSRRSARYMREFREGWLAPSVLTCEQATRFAADAGFELLQNLDLTPYLELDRPRDRALTLAVSLGRLLPIRGYRWRSVLGGAALQAALKRGFIEYRFMVWRSVSLAED